MENNNLNENKPVQKILMIRDNYEWLITLKQIFKLKDSVILMEEADITQFGEKTKEELGENADKFEYQLIKLIDNKSFYLSVVVYKYNNAESTVFEDSIDKHFKDSFESAEERNIAQLNYRFIKNKYFGGLNFIFSVDFTMLDFITVADLAALIGIPLHWTAYDFMKQHLEDSGKSPIHFTEVAKYMFKKSGDYSEFEIQMLKTVLTHSKFSTYTEEDIYETFGCAQSLMDALSDIECRIIIDIIKFCLSNQISFVEFVDLFNLKFYVMTNNIKLYMQYITKNRKFFDFLISLDERELPARVPKNKAKMVMIASEIYSANYKIFDYYKLDDMFNFVINMDMIGAVDIEDLSISLDINEKTLAALAFLTKKYGVFTDEGVNVLMRLTDRDNYSGNIKRLAMDMYHNKYICDRYCEEYTPVVFAEPMFRSVLRTLLPEDQISFKMIMARYEHMVYVSEENAMVECKNLGMNIHLVIASLMHDICIQDRNHEYLPELINFYNEITRHAAAGKTFRLFEKIRIIRDVRYYEKIVLGRASTRSM